MDVRVHRTRIERIDADLFGFYPLAEIAERMERGEDSLRSIRSAIWSRPSSDLKQ
jgi:hypothetical protein